MVGRRSRIALTTQEQRDLLESARVLQVASINRDGTPHVVPMWFVFDDDGRLAFTTYGTSQKIRNIERDPRVTVLAECGTQYAELRGVSLDGRAEIVRDPAVTARVMQLVGAKHGGRPRPRRFDGTPPSAALKRVTVVIEPLRSRSWDHGKIR